MAGAVGVEIDRSAAPGQIHLEVVLWAEVEARVLIYCQYHASTTGIS